MRASFSLDSNALLDILQAYGNWDPAKDAKLDALNSLLMETFPDQKVLVFSQFADTVDYLEAQLKKRGVADMAGVTGNSAAPTDSAWRFSPDSNQRPGQGKPERELRVLVATDVLSEGQNLQDSHVVVNYDLPWAIIRLIQRAGRVDRIGQKAEEILCHSFLPAEGVERIIDLRGRVRERLRENAEVVGADEAFFEDEGEDHDQAIVNLYHERAGILDGDPEGDVDLASHAYQIWKNAIGADPSLEKAVANLPDVVFSSRQHAPIAQRPEGVLVFMRTSDGNDALAYVDRKGQSITESQLEILSAAECRPDTPAQPHHESHHELVAEGVKHVVREEKRVGGQLGRPSGARFRTYTRLKAYADSIKGQLFDVDALHKAIDDIYRYPLRPSAVDTLNRQLRSGVSDDQLSEIVMSLREEDRLCLTGDAAAEAQEPTDHLLPGAVRYGGRLLMPVSIEELRPHLQAFDFPRLFVEGLGWDHYVTEPFVVRINERDYALNPIAEKAGFAVYECDSSVDNNIPQYPIRRKIESEVAKRTFEHLIIFTDAGP